jgi:hypothetical protein
MLAELERFGRYSLDSSSSGVDVSKFWEIVGPMVLDLKANPDVFINELEAVIANDKGGFATFGAARLMFEVFGIDCLSVTAALPLIDAGIEFKAARGRTQMYYMTGYEQQRIADRRSQGENI